MHNNWFPRIRCFPDKKYRSYIEPVTLVVKLDTKNKTLENKILTQKHWNIAVKCNAI